MKKLDLEIIREWLITNKKDFILCNDNTYEGSKKKLKIYHSVCGEYFYMNWNDIYTGYGCSVCGGHQVGKNNNLKHLHKNLIKEWDYENNLTLSPENVTSGSSKKAWWICKNCGYNWISSVKSRVRGRGCPACAGKVVTDNNSLKSLFPDIAKEWHQLKNGTLTPDEITYGSKNKIWWKCVDCNFEWNTTPNKRTYRKDGCPKCSSSKGEKRVAIFLVSKNIEFHTEYRIENCRNILQLPFDFYLPKYNLMIEYDGEFHYKDIFDNPIEFKNAKMRDKIKTRYCKNNNIYLIRIPYWEFNRIEEILEKALL